MSGRSSKAMAFATPLFVGTIITFTVFTVMPPHIANPLSLTGLASGARTYVRAGLGQVLDYARFLDHESKALLVPVRPSENLLDLLNDHGCAVIWPDGSDFKRHDP